MSEDRVKVTSVSGDCVVASGVDVFFYNAVNKPEIIKPGEYESVSVFIRANGEVAVEVRYKPYAREG